MKPKLKNYEVLIALIIIANILIFMFFSRGLEGLVSSYASEIEIEGGLVDK